MYVGWRMFVYIFDCSSEAVDASTKHSHPFPSPTTHHAAGPCHARRDGVVSNPKGMSCSVCSTLVAFFSSCGTSWNGTVK